MVSSAWLESESGEGLRFWLQAKGASGTVWPETGSGDPSGLPLRGLSPFLFSPGQLWTPM